MADNLLAVIGFKQVGLRGGFECFSQSLTKCILFLEAGNSRQEEQPRKKSDVQTFWS